MWTMTDDKPVIKHDMGPFRGVTPGGDITTKMPKVGGKIKIEKVSLGDMVAIANELVKGTAFVLDPQKHNKDTKEPWFREAALNAGTMFLNFRVSTRGEKVFIIGYMNKTKIDVFLASQGDELLKLCKDLGKDDITITEIEVTKGAYDGKTRPQMSVQ